jgi:hypothetical protein
MKRHGLCVGSSAHVTDKRYRLRHGSPSGREQELSLSRSLGDAPNLRYRALASALGQ